MRVNVIPIERVRPDNARGQTSRVGRIPQDVLKIAIRTETMGERVRRLRLARGWSQSQMAEVTGVPKPQISMVELGLRADPQVRTMAHLARGLGVSIDDLFYGTGAAS